jgi:hypothetical protein
MPDEFIGKVAMDSGLSIDTIRFYEKMGLIERPARTKGGFDVSVLRIFRICE